MMRYFSILRTSRSQQAQAIALVVILVNGLLFSGPLYRLVGADIALGINNLSNIVAALISIWLGYRLWRSSPRGESQRMVWGCLVTGLALWMVAEISWDATQVLQGIQLPSASAADVAWTLGYVAVILGLTVRLSTLRMRLSKAWQYASLAAFGVIVVLAGAYLIIPALNASKTGISYKIFVDLFYPVCALVVACLALLLVLLLDGGLLSRPWVVIAIACFFVAVSNLLYAFAFSNGLYQVDPPAGLDLLSYLVDLSYSAAYVLMALGIYLQARLQAAA